MCGDNNVNGGKLKSYNTIPTCFHHLNLKKYAYALS